MGHRYSIIPYVNLPEGWLGPVTGETEGQTIDRLQISNPLAAGFTSVEFFMGRVNLFRPQFGWLSHTETRQREEKAAVILPVSVHFQ